MTATTILLLIVGIVALVIGAEGLVRGAARLAARTGMSSVVIGLTVVAFGTSAPELAVSVGDAIRGGDEPDRSRSATSSDRTSPTSCWCSGWRRPSAVSLFVAQRIVRLDVPIMIGVSVLVLLFVLDERLGRGEGLVLVVLLVGLHRLDGDRGDAWIERRHRRRVRRGARRRELAESSVIADVGYLVARPGAAGGRIAGARRLRDRHRRRARRQRAGDRPDGRRDRHLAPRGRHLGARGASAASATSPSATRSARTCSTSWPCSASPRSCRPTALPVASSAVHVDIPVMMAVAVACLPIFANGHVLNRWEGVIFLVLYAGYIDLARARRQRPRPARRRTGRRWCSS